MTGMAFSMVILALNSVEISDDVVAEVAVSVRELTGGGAFPVPRLELQSGESYDKAANRAKSLGGSTDPARLGTRAEIPMYYDRERNSVVMRSDYRIGEAMARTGQEISTIAKLLLMHEVVHAWQLVHAVPLLDRMAPADALVIQALLEGHAEYVVALYCERTQQEVALSRILERRRSSQGILVGPKNSDISFLYDEGMRFWQVVNSSGHFAFPDLVERGLPTQKEIVFPSTYGTPRTTTEVDWLQQLCPAAASIQPVRPNDLGFVSFRAYLRTLGMSPPVHVRLLDDFNSCTQFRSGSGTVTGTCFQAPLSAKICFQVVGKQHRAHAVDANVATGTRASILWMAHRPRNAEVPTSTLLLNDDVWVIEITEIDASAHELDLQAWSESKMAIYEGVRSATAGNPTNPNPLPPVSR